MEQVSSNHSNSSNGLLDQILLEKCLWVISLESCCTAYAIALIISQMFEFILTIVFTSQCCKKFIKFYMTQIHNHQRRPAPRTPSTSAEGDQMSSEVEAGPDAAEGARRESLLRRTSFLISVALDNLKLTNPSVAGMLAYNVMMVVVGVLTEDGIAGKKAELYKMCITVITFGNIIFFVIVTVSTFDLCIRRKMKAATGNLVFFVLTLYATLVLWSYSRYLDSVNN